MTEAGANRWPELLAKLLRRQDLVETETAWAMSEIIAGHVSPAKLAAFLVALRAKGETPSEVRGMVQALLDAAPVLQIPGDVLDIVGTGGARGLNISTMASMVVAAAGVTVVKHGNRAASSACGSADLVERIGISLELDPAQVAWVAAKAGITFCFAPRFHPGLRHAAGTRRELGVPTVFNFLGPLANPARPRFLLVGVSEARIAPIAAQVLEDRGCSALVVRGDDGLDELTTAAPSTVWVVQGAAVVQTRVDPATLGVPRAPAEALRGGTPDENHRAMIGLVGGAHGPVRDAVVLNAAAALLTVEGPPPQDIAAALAERMRTCEQLIDSGAVKNTLSAWVEAARAAVQDSNPLKYHDRDV